jgi:hypothetical protein
MNTSFHVYDENNSPITGLINLDEDQLLRKLKERVNKHEEMRIVKVEGEEMNDASY